MDIKTAVIYRLNDLINQKDITVNEAAVCSGVPSYSVKPKSIDFTGFDDIYLPQNKSRE